LLGLAGWLVWQGGWLFGLITAVAFFLDSRLPDPLKRHHYLAGVAFVVTAGLVALRGPAARGTAPATVGWIAALAVSALNVLTIGVSHQMQSVADATGEPLTPLRVQAAQVLALATALLSTWWYGARGAVMLLTLWASLAGAGLYQLLMFSLQGLPPSEGERNA
jgi:hypothetical protein